MNQAAEYHEVRQVANKLESMTDTQATVARTELMEAIAAAQQAEVGQAQRDAGCQRSQQRGSGWLVRLFRWFSFRS